MKRTPRLSAPFRLLFALFACAAIAACSSQPKDEGWSGDDGGYGGTGRFNPIGSEESQSN